MASKTEIANLAISHLGSGKEISNLDSDASDEAAACRRYYELALDSTLRDVNWPFARRYYDLGVVGSPPNDEWDYSYRYPSDCIKIHRIFSGIRVETNDIRIPYEVGSDTTGLLIYTDEVSASIEYTLRQTDPQIFPSDFIMALSYKLAMYIAPRITGGDPYGLGAKAAQMYEVEISKAAKNSFNEQQPDPEPGSELERSRT